MRPLIALYFVPLLFACGKVPSPPPAPETPQQADARELTLQARRDWTPEAPGRKLVIALISEKTKIRKGEPFGYRLETRNVGGEPLAFREPSPSFIKDGTLCGAHGWSFVASLPDGAERVLPCAPLAAPPPTPPLDLTLKPGDYLLTRRSDPKNPFRALATSFVFDRPGVYRLRAAYEDAGVRAVSNAVTLTVVP
jgi:hypothetical protein